VLGLYVLPSRISVPTAAVRYKNRQLTRLVSGFLNKIVTDKWQ